VYVLERAGASLAGELTRLAHRAVDLAPTPMGRAMVLLMIGQALCAIGRLTEAVAAFEEIRGIIDTNRLDAVTTLAGESTGASLAYLYAVTGRADEALAVAPIATRQLGD